MTVLDAKFSNFVDGGDLAIDDVVVGLRNGLNTRFSYQGQVGIFLPLVGGTMAGAIDMDSNSINNLPAPTNPNDAVRKSYADLMLPLSGGTMSGNINFSGFKGINAADPSDPQDYATKFYVDSTGSGTVNAGLINQLAWYAAGGTVVSGLATGNSGILVTSSGGVPSIATDIPTAVTIGGQYIYRVGGTDVSVSDGGTGLSAITAHYLPIGNGTSALTLLAPSATSGVPLISQGAAADPVYGTAVVEGGGTGNTTFTAYSIICAGTTSTGAFQNVVGLGTAGQVLQSNGAGLLPTWATIPGATSAALTKTDDTNVTLTLGGSPSTALLTATSLTLGWTGQLGFTRGGTNASLTASNGGIVYSTASAMAILAGTATAGQMLQSGASTTPAWSTAAYPATAGTSGNVITSNGTNFVSSAPAAATATTITDDTTTNATMYPVWVTANTGSLPLKVSSTKMSFNPSTGLLNLAGYLQTVQGVKDSNGNIILAYTTVASAVNYVALSNAASGNNPFFTATGTNANISIGLQPKGDASVQILGNSTRGGTFNIYENSANGTDYVQLKSPESLAATTTIYIFQETGATGYIPQDSSSSPAWTDFSGSVGFTGFSANPTSIQAFYKKIGKTCFIQIAMTAGTSNATSFTITGLPFTSATGRNQFAGLFTNATNNSAATFQASAVITTATTTITLVNGTGGGGGWTASGTKGVNFEMFYETA